jgi:hypothetical protein
MVSAEFGQHGIEFQRRSTREVALDLTAGMGLLVFGFATAGAKSRIPDSNFSEQLTEFAGIGNLESATQTRIQSNDDFSWPFDQRDTGRSAPEAVQEWSCPLTISSQSRQNQFDRHRAHGYAGGQVQCLPIGVDRLQPHHPFHNPCHLSLPPPSTEMWPYSPIISPDFFYPRVYSGVFVGHEPLLRLFAGYNLTSIAAKVI